MHGFGRNGLVPNLRLVAYRPTPTAHATPERRPRVRGSTESSPDGIAGTDTISGETTARGRPRRAKRILPGRGFARLAERSQLRVAPSLRWKLRAETYVGPGGWCAWRAARHSGGRTTQKARIFRRWQKENAVNRCASSGGSTTALLGKSRPPFRSPTRLGMLAVDESRGQVWDLVHPSLPAPGDAGQRATPADTRSSGGCGFSGRLAFFPSGTCRGAQGRHRKSLLRPLERRNASPGRSQKRR